VRTQVKGGLTVVPYLVQEIRRLSQEEGLNDQEIAAILGCSRATVNRTRQANNIPTANLENRKDKEYTCTFCNKVVVIARKERKKRYCDDCREQLNIQKK
jgi:transcriptional regulator with XRE-family HTH domain